MEALSRRQPVLAMFEDVHWIDPTSREMLDLMVDRARRMPVLLIVTFRPEFQESWVGQPHVTMLALNRLDERHVAALVLGLAGNAPLGSEVVQEIAERTDGVPLFVEELTKAVLERADQDHRVAAILSASPLPALAVPATLHASLIARLDRIGPAAKEVAQICSVLGREFTYELIERLAARPRLDLDRALAQLAEAGLLFCRGVPPESVYFVQARAGAGRRLWDAAARKTAGIARPGRGGAGTAFCRSCRAPTRTLGASPERRGPDRACG
jgi:predicted ATPase